jgi:hypothetical protein
MALQGWLSSFRTSRSEPPKFESDHVVPLRFFDDTTPLRGSVLAWTFRIDDVLDHHKLHSALSTLLGIPSWRQLGGRLRLGVRRSKHCSVHSVLIILDNW